MVDSLLRTDRLVVETARLSDLDELEMLEKECDAYFSFDPPDENNHSMPIRQCLAEGDLPPGGCKENDFFCTIRQGSAMVGFLSFYVGHPHGRSAYINCLYIARLHRGSGLGQEIISALIRHLKSLGICEVRLHVSLRNATGLRFWVKNGFDQIMQVQCKGNLLPGSFAGVELLRLI